MSEHTPEQIKEALDFLVSRTYTFKVGSKSRNSERQEKAFQIILQSITELSALRAQVEEKNKALAEAERWFREYAELHSAKGNRDKAIRNMDRAMILHAALDATGKE